MPVIPLQEGLEPPEPEEAPDPLPAEGLPPVGLLEEPAEGPLPELPVLPPEACPPEAWPALPPEPLWPVVESSQATRAHKSRAEKERVGNKRMGKPPGGGS